MINYYRFSRRRVLSILVEEFHIAVFPVRVKYFQVTKTKASAAKSFRRTIASIRMDRNSVDAAQETVQHSNA